MLFIFKCFKQIICMQRLEKIVDKEFVQYTTDIVSLTTMHRSHQTYRFDVGEISTLRIASAYHSVISELMAEINNRGLNKCSS